MRATIYFYTNESITKTAADFCDYFSLTLKPYSNSLVLDVNDVFIEVRRNPEGLDYGRFNIPFPENYDEFNNCINFVWEDDPITEKVILMMDVMLGYFWSRGVPAVAFGYCTHFLPFNGGYNCKHLPWPKEVDERR